jgi:hypothetical protein
LLCFANLKAPAAPSRQRNLSGAASDDGFRVNIRAVDDNWRAERLPETVAQDSGPGKIKPLRLPNCVVYGATNQARSRGGKFDAPKSSSPEGVHDGDAKEGDVFSLIGDGLAAQ